MDPQMVREVGRLFHAAGVIAAWNRREPDWEKKWGELVETVCRRTDQANGAEVSRTKA